MPPPVPQRESRAGLITAVVILSILFVTVTVLYIYADGERRREIQTRVSAEQERTLSENKTETLAAPGITARPGQPFRVQLDDFGFSFTPKPP